MVKEIVSQADILSPAVQEAQILAEAKNAAKRQAERQAAYDAWKDPEEMEKRRVANEEAAAASLAYLQAVMAPEDDIEIPDPLPPELQGQPLSTIKKMLRHKKYGDGYDPYRKIEFRAEAEALQKASEKARQAALRASSAIIEKAMKPEDASAFTGGDTAPLKSFGEAVTATPIQKAAPKKLPWRVRFWRWLTT